MAHLGDFNIGKGGIPNLGNLGNNDPKPPDFDDHKWKNLTARERWEAQVEYNMDVLIANQTLQLKNLEQVNNLILAVARLKGIKPEELDREGTDVNSNAGFLQKMQQSSVGRQKKDFENEQKLKKTFNDEHPTSANGAGAAVSAQPQIAPQKAGSTDSKVDSGVRIQPAGGSGQGQRPHHRPRTLLSRLAAWFKNDSDSQG